ncbi:MAG: NERD domain-containing protein/DEAD/DEAH box helicase, partial [Lutispora sp.]
MARMIPDSLEFENCKSNGEKRIFDALKEKLPQDWVVIYSLRWVNIYNERSRKSNGEGDFLIISPKYGILVIEVKGGEINCKDKSWMSKDQNGITNNIQDPEKQANDTMYEIIGLLKTKGINGYVCSAVWFPDTIIEKINLPLSMPPHIVLDMRSLENPGKSISDVFEFRKSREKFSPKVFDKADFIRILDILNPEVRLVKAIKRIAEDVKDTYVRLNQEQSYAIEQFEENKRISIKGHAGTGKTLLAIQKCRKDSNEGKKVLFLCFNSKLADNIKNESNDFDVYTIHSFALNYLKRFFPARALNFDEDKDFDYIVEEYLEVIQKNKEKGFLLYDIIVVDEGQDFKEAWISSLENLINEEGSFFIFYDPLQVLYSDRAQADYSYLSIGAVCNLY